jgi:hypothetical protein
MKVDFTSPIKGLGGKEIVDSVSKEPLTLRSLAVNVLMTNSQMSGEEKMRRFKLAERIYDEIALPLELSSEDAKLISQLIGASPYGPGIAAPAMRMLSE